MENWHSNLINRQYNNAQLVIDGMFQVHAVDRLLKHVEGYWEAKTSKVTATKTKGLSRRRNKVRKLKELIAKRERVQRNVEAKYQSVHERLVEKEARFRDALATRENHLGRVQYAEKEHSEALEEKGQVIGEIVQVIKNPCSFSPYVAATLGALKLGLDEAKLPESAAREFFTELSRQMLCVCGRPLNFETRRAIRDRSSEYLGSEDVALLNAMKAAIGDAMECNPPHDAILSTLTIGLAKQARRVGELRTTLSEIEEEAAAGDPRLEVVHREIERLREREQELKTEKRRFDDPTTTAGDQETVGIEVLRRRLTLAEDKLAEITDTMEIRRKRDIVKTVLRQAQVGAREALGTMICGEANERVAYLMPKNSIRIKKVERFLLLDGQAAGSTGENLGVAYAFLSSLFSRSEFTLPVVVDSPANPIDLEVRAQVGRLIPKLSKQFVAFTISSERRGFLEALEGVASDKIQYATLFRKGDEELEARARREREVRETTDGMLVHGRDYFRGFQLDEE